MTDFYFAYGSNMNPGRMRRRDMAFDHHQGGILRDFRLAFNKRSVKYPGAASANVMFHRSGTVEGVIYRLPHEREIERMDPYEGGYDRRRLAIHCDDGIFQAWVYVARQDYLIEGGNPNRWYLNHLLAGSPLLSTAYIRMLEQTECLPDSALEVI